MSNVGNIDITHTDQSVELRMRHVVAGHPGCVLSLAEVPVLIAQLEAAVASAKRTAPAAVEPDPFEDLI